MDGYRPKSSWVEWGVAVGGLFLVLAILMLGLVGLSRARELRCYSLSPRLSQTTQSMMSSPAFACMDHRCWMVLKLTPQRGLACFFSPQSLGSQPWPRETRLTDGAVTRRASQRSSGPRAYRTG